MNILLALCFLVGGALMLVWRRPAATYTRKFHGYPEQSQKPLELGFAFIGLAFTLAGLVGIFLFLKDWL